MSDDFQRELAFLGMASSPSFVREPEGNGCRRAVHPHAEGELAVGADLRHRRGAGRGPAASSSGRYNEQWLIERHGFRTPNQARADFVAASKAVGFRTCVP